MNDTSTYTIQLHGLVSEGEINATSPLPIMVTAFGQASTLLTFSADQSGLVGLIRHLHGLGFVFVSICRVETPEGV